MASKKSKTPWLPAPKQLKFERKLLPVKPFSKKISLKRMYPSIKTLKLEQKSPLSEKNEPTK